MEDFSCEHLNNEPYHREWIDELPYSELITGYEEE